MIVQKSPPMTLPGNAVLQPVAMSVLTRMAGSDTGSAAVAGAAQHAFDDLGKVLITLIGQVGFDALITRALHLVQREYPAILIEGDHAGPPATHVRHWLEKQESAMDPAAAVLSTVGGLLETFIGEPLTMRLLRKAWPDGFPEAPSQEKLR